MVTSVRARYAKGVFTPLEPLEFEEGKEVKLSIEDATPRDSESTLTSEDFGKPKQRHETVSEMFERYRRSIPKEAWEGKPTDWAKNKRHYLYGHPKEED